MAALGTFLCFNASRWHYALRWKNCIRRSALKTFCYARSIIAPEILHASGDIDGLSKVIEPIIERNCQAGALMNSNLEQKIVRQ
jgi:hypothetical protein